MKSFLNALIAVLLPPVLAGIVACAGAKSTVRLHPEEIKGPPQCSSCHEADQALFDHGVDFVSNHRDLAVQGSRTCELCHQPSSCADCHGRKEELRPSEKNLLRPGSSAPHRGDYLTQHRVDGRLNPAPCFGCHGRKNDWRCRECHR